MEEEDDGPSDEWLASYADAMTLLLAFFIMMFAFALIDEGKFFDLKVGIATALGTPAGIIGEGDAIVNAGHSGIPEIATEQEAEQVRELTEELVEQGVVTVENAQALADLLEMRFDLAGAGELVDVGIDERGVYIRFADNVLFEAGSAELDLDNLPILMVASQVLSTVSNPLEIEGHTDSDPIASLQFPSNWELSGSRASRVVRFMSGSGGIAEPRLTVLAKADTRPIGSNNTEEGKRRNRRVEIVTRVAEIPSRGTSGGATGPVGEGAGVDPDSSTGAEPALGPGDETDGGVEPPEGDGVPDSLGQPDGTTDGTSDDASGTPGDGGSTGDDQGPPTRVEDLETIDPIGDDPVGVGRPRSF